MAWVEAVSTGRTTSEIRVEGRDAWRGRSVVMSSAVDGPQTWTQTRANVSLFVLQDEHGFTAQQARNATVPALVLWAQETGYGRHEWNWNPSNLHCRTRDASDGDCVRFASSAEKLQAFNALGDGVRAFWDRVDRIDLAMAHLKAGGNLDPLMPPGPWARISSDDARALWNRVTGYLNASGDAGELPANPYERGGGAVRRRSGWTSGRVALAAAFFGAAVYWDNKRGR